MVDRYKERKDHYKIDPPNKIKFSPFKYVKRITSEICDIGEDNFPVVVTDLSQLNEITSESLGELGITYDNKSKIWERLDISPDYLYVGDKNIKIDDLKYNFILDYDHWLSQKKNDSYYPLLNLNEFKNLDSGRLSEKLNFLLI